MNRRSVSAFLLLLMLSNSSLALELITHDGHQHEATSGAHAMLDGQLQVNHMAEQLIPEFAATPALVDHGEDDCVCDDICCVSSVQFACAGSDSIYPGLLGSDAPIENLYQSISLDLVLPPPTA